MLPGEGPRINEMYPMMDSNCASEVPQLSNEMQLSIMNKVKSGELTIEDALKQARMENQEMLKQSLAVEQQQDSQYNFSVFKYNRYRWQKRVLQIDFNTRMMCSIEKGIIKRQLPFLCVKGCDDGAGAKFSISFRGRHDYELEATSLEDKHKMMQLVNKIIYRNIYSHPAEGGAEMPKQPPAPKSLREGQLFLQRGGLASIKWVRYEAHLHPGQLTVVPLSRGRRVADGDIMSSSMSLPLVIHLSDGDASVEKPRSCDTFTLLTHKNEYQFRIPVTDHVKSSDAIQRERDAWVLAIDKLCLDWKRKSQSEHLYEDLRAVRGDGYVKEMEQNKTTGKQAGVELVLGADCLSSGDKIQKTPAKPVPKPCSPVESLMHVPVPVHMSPAPTSPLLEPIYSVPVPVPPVPGLYSVPVPTSPTPFSFTSSPVPDPIYAVPGPIPASPLRVPVPTIPVPDYIPTSPIPVSVSTRPAPDYIPSSPSHVFVAHPPVLDPAKQVVPPAFTIPAPPPLPFKPKSKPLSERTKAFHWDVVSSDKIEKSFWSRGSGGKKKIDTSRLYEQFAVQYLGTFGGMESSSNSVHIMLNQKIAHNFNIFLKSFPVQSGELKDKLFMVNEDDGGLSDEHITSLRRYVPTSDDVEMYKSYKGPVSELHVVDQYMMEMCTIPYLSTRLDLLLSLRELPISMKDLQPLINQKIMMCMQLYGSRSFASVLEHLLAVGNYLNENAGKEKAKGFRLSSLTKLSQLRGKDRRFTLLHVLVEQIMLHEPGLATFPQELAEFETVPGASIKGLTAEVDVLKNELQKVIQYRKTYKRRNQGDQQHPKFFKDLKTAIEKYKTDLSLLTKRCEEMKKLYTDILIKFGESLDQDSQELFGLVCQFLIDFKRAHTEIS